MKIHYNLSENHILEMLHDMKAMCKRPKVVLGNP